jgi:hypothetical protein
MTIRANITICVSIEYITRNIYNPISTIWVNVIEIPIHLRTEHTWVVAQGYYTGLSHLLSITLRPQEQCVVGRDRL